MTTITKKITTEISVEGIEDVVNVLLSEENVTAEAVEAIQKRFGQIVMPWRQDGCVPPGYVRKLADGRQVGEVNARLGGFANPHRPREHGWGYKGNNPRGQGACTSGIEKVEWNNSSANEEDVKAVEYEALLRAMDKVDGFLRQEFPDLILLPGIQERR